MAIRPKNQIGTMKCLCCGETVPVKEADSGTLNFSCGWCDFPAYAKAGTQANRLVRKAMKPIPTAAPDPSAANPGGAPVAAPIPQSKPAPAARKLLF